MKYLDFLQRKVNSLLFRITLILYAIYILYSSANKFIVEFYILSIAIYVIIYIYTASSTRRIANFSNKKSNLIYDQARLVNDYIFISIILLGKDPNNIIYFFLLILPLINSINFSGEKRTILIYLLSISIFLGLEFYSHYNYGQEYELSIINSKVLVIVFTLGVINQYTSLRAKIRSFRDDLNNVIDNHYLNPNKLRKPHSIYKPFIESINKNLKDKLNVNDIICFTIVGQKTVLVNSSSFIWTAEFKNNDLVQEIRTSKFLTNQIITINNNEYSINLILYSEAGEYEYIYVILTNKPIPFYYELIGFFRTINPSLSKISKMLVSEKHLQEFTRNEIVKLSERRQYITRANSTMHYIRNRLTPFNNLIDLVENLDKDTPPYQNNQQLLKQLIQKENSKAKTELNQIIDRANSMLEKNDNPFVYTSLNKISLEKVFTILKSKWSAFFPEHELSVDIMPSKDKKYIFINEEGFDIFLSDWFNNMNKYSNQFVDCHFLIKEDFLHISFYNDYNLSTEDINKLISDLTDSDRNEIMKRTTHGLYTIKLILDDMNITYKIQDISKKLVFNLKFQLNNEDSYI